MSRESSYNFTNINDHPALPRLNSSSNIALEKLKRRATTIRPISSVKLEEMGEAGGDMKAESLSNISPLNSIRRDNARRRMSSINKLEINEETIKDLKSIGETNDNVKEQNHSSISISDKIATVAEGLNSEDENKDEKEGKIVNFKRLYIQLDSKVKKISYHGPLTISSMNMLFVEHFQYNPGSNQFPELYIRDPFKNVFYELEDINEVVDGSILQLNVSVSSMDLKKEMDSQFSTLMMEIKDIRRLITRKNTENRKAANTLSMAVPNNSSRLADIVKLAMAQNLDQNANLNTVPSSNSSLQVPTVLETNVVETPAPPNLIKTIDLSPLQEEIKVLKNDLSIIRQVANEFQKETDSVVKDVTKSINLFSAQLANDSDQIYKLIVAGKNRMEENALTLANKLEEIQTNIDDFRTDLVQRRAQPSELRMKYTMKLLDEVNQMLLDEGEFITEVKPTWKKVWEKTLQNIVQEQQTLKEQESIVEDMRSDLNNLYDTFSKLQEFIKLKRQSGHILKTFEVAPMNENFTRDAVFQEIQCIDISSERRLKALEQSIQARKWELENQVNPFEEELTDFVSTSKLRKTGGTEELERRRKEQDELNLKAMLNSNKK